MGIVGEVKTSAETYFHTPCEGGVQLWIEVTEVILNSSLLMKSISSFSHFGASSEIIQVIY